MIHAEEQENGSLFLEEKRGCNLARLTSPFNNFACKAPQTTNIWKSKNKYYEWKSYIIKGGGWVETAKL